VRKVQLGAAAWAILVLALLAIHVFFPQRSGVLALTQVFEPYIVITGLIAAAFAVGIPGRWAKVLAVVLVVATVARYGPGFVSFPSAVAAGSEGITLKVSAWNVEGGADGAQRVVEGLEQLDADIVGVEELQPAMADALSADPAITRNLPHQVLMPDEGTLGAGLLSRYPISEQSQSMNPTYVRAVIQLPSGQPVTVFVVHPLPPEFVTIAGIPVALDTNRRDSDIGEIRSLIDADLSAGQSVIVVGDSNTTDREPAYDDIGRGLHDSHLVAGLGPGLTWRPDELKGLPFGLLRIDYAFASPAFAFQSSTVDCSSFSDHCRLDTSLVQLTY